MSTSLILGFDRGTYPGSAHMQALFENTNLAFCGLYLAPSPGHVDTGWMDGGGEQPPNPIGTILRDQGWALAPIYYGRQTLDVYNPNAGTFDDLDAAGGKTDAQDASSLAAAAGLADGVIYLDIESSVIADKMTEYAQSWIDEIGQGPYSAGVYSHKSYLDVLVAKHPEIFTWVVKFNEGDGPEFDGNGAVVAPGDPATYGPATVVWQYALDWAGPLSFTDETGTKHRISGLDFDVSNVGDPSFPAAAAIGKSCGRVTQLTCEQAAVIGGDEATLHISASKPAPWPNGLLVELSTDSSPDLIALPASTRIPALQTQITLSIATSVTRQDVRTTISANALFQTTSVGTQLIVQGT